MAHFGVFVNKNHSFTSQKGHFCQKPLITPREKVSKELNSLKKSINPRAKSIKMAKNAKKTLTLLGEKVSFSYIKGVKCVDDTSNPPNKLS